MDISSCSLKPGFTTEHFSAKSPAISWQRNTSMVVQPSASPHPNEPIVPIIKAIARRIPHSGQPSHLQMPHVPKRAQFFQTKYPANKLNLGMMTVDAGESGRIVSVHANASYAASLESSAGSSFIIRPLAEILRDLNKKVPDQVLKDKPGSAHQKYIPWYQANRMLSFYAPGWCGEVRDITFSGDGKFVTVIYRVTIRGSDGEAFREASGTIFTGDSKTEDPSQHAEQVAFVRACARFGLGLYLHHGEE